MFRDVRFLISPIENCDMIIGARSIRKDKILDVPFLGINGGNKIFVSEDDAGMLSTKRSMLYIETEID